MSKNLLVNELTRTSRDPKMGYKTQIICNFKIKKKLTAIFSKQFCTFCPDPIYWVTFYREGFIIYKETNKVKNEINFANHLHK